METVPGRVGRPAVSIIDDDGAVKRTFDVDRALGSLGREDGASSSRGARGMRAVAVRGEVWIVPNAAYRLWRPAQRGKPFKEVDPAECLVTKGSELTGEANAKHVLELSKGWSIENRDRLKEAVERGGLQPSFLACTAGAVAHGNTLALVVRDGLRGGALRIDLWDMLTEQVVAVSPFPDDAALLALEDGFAWIRKGGGVIERYALPALGEPGVDACRLLAAALAQEVLPPTPRTATHVEAQSPNR